MLIKIIHFSSPTCTVCENQDKILSDLKRDKNIDYISRIITTDFADALKFGVKSAPTLVYISEEKALAVKPGLQSRQMILDILSHIND